MTWIRIGSAFALLMLLMTLAGTAWAEEGESRAIAKGRWSLAFSLPQGGGTRLGVWKMVSGRSNLGVSLGIDHRFNEETWGPDSSRFRVGTLFWTFSLEPAVKRYLFLREQVSPFLVAALRGSYGWAESGSMRRFNRSATLTAGLGADWTPLRDVSIGASTGIEWTEGMESQNDSDATKDKLSLFGTKTGALTLHLYF